MRLAAAEALVKGSVTNAHIRTVQAHGANENTLAALREDVKQKTFAVQSLIGQRERLHQFISLARRAVEPAKLPDVMQAALASKSQFMQEPFAFALAGGRRDGVFVEIGAGDGMNLSNTVLLERELGKPQQTCPRERACGKRRWRKTGWPRWNFRCVSAPTGGSRRILENPEKAGNLVDRQAESWRQTDFANGTRSKQSRSPICCGATRPLTMGSCRFPSTPRERNTTVSPHSFSPGSGSASSRSSGADVESGEIAALLDSRGYEPLFPRAPKLSNGPRVERLRRLVRAARGKSGARRRRTLDNGDVASRSAHAQFIDRFEKFLIALRMRLTWWRWAPLSTSAARP